MTAIKQELYLLCEAFVQNRIDAINHAIASSQQAANEETKSSAGDKYETGRAMMQQETDQNRTQLSEAGKLQIALKNISTNTTYHTAEPGSLVTTDQGNFYIAISAGALTVNGKTYFAISPASPIGQKIKGQKAGFEFNINGNNYRIICVN